MTQFKSNTNIDFGVYFARCCWKNRKTVKTRCYFSFFGEGKFGLKKGVRWDVWVLIETPPLLQRRKGKFIRIGHFFPIAWPFRKREDWYWHAFFLSLLLQETIARLVR